MSGFKRTFFGMSIERKLKAKEMGNTEKIRKGLPYFKFSRVRIL